MSHPILAAVNLARKLLNEFDHDLNDGDIDACIDKALELVTASAMLHGFVVRLDERDLAECERAGLEALSEPIVAEWGEVKDRLGLEHFENVTREMHEAAAKAVRSRPRRYNREVKD